MKQLINLGRKLFEKFNVKKEILLAGSRYRLFWEFKKSNLNAILSI